jgi:TatD family-associated radical SAM protein
MDNLAQTIAYPINGRLYLNITDRCTLQCAFCPKHRASRQVRGYDLTLQHRPTFDEVMEAMGRAGSYPEVVFCGFGEPTLRLKLLLRVAAQVKARGARVRLNSDGLANRVHKRNVLPEMQGAVDALSVSMNAQSAEVYARHCRPTLAGSYEAMLRFLELAPRYVPEVTATAIDGLDGVQVEACAALAQALGVRFRRRVLDEVG